MKTILIFILLLVSISMIYFTYFYNPLALWITMAVGLIVVIWFLIINKKESKSFTNRSVPYKTPKTLIVLIVSGMFFSCGPSRSQRSHIINEYENTHQLYIAVLDSSKIETHVMAKDKYQAMRYFDDVFAKDNISESYKILAYPIYLLQ